ncbi:MAG: hypothetical protein ABIP49_07960 [Lysobacterales bacterium]
MSAILTVLLSVIHSAVGEKLILIPLQHSEGLPAVRGSVRSTRETLRFAWHVTSVFGLGIAAILFRYARMDELDSGDIFILKTLSLTFLASFIVAIVGSRARHPSWIVFALLSLLTWLGTK